MDNIDKYCIYFKFGRLVKQHRTIQKTVYTWGVSKLARVTAEI